MQPRQRHVGMREGELCEQVPADWPPLMLHSLSELGPGVPSGQNIMGTSKVWCSSGAAQGVTVQLGDSTNHVPTLTLSPGILSKRRVSLHGGSVLPGEGASSPACSHNAVLILSVVQSLASLHPWLSYFFPLKHPVGGKQGNPSCLFQVEWDCVQSSDT